MIALTYPIMVGLLFPALAVGWFSAVQSEWSVRRVAALVVRTLVLGLLALVWTDPRWIHSGANPMVVGVLDSSTSIDDAALAQGLAAWKNRIKGITSGTQVALVRVDNQAQVVDPATGITVETLRDTRPKGTDLGTGIQVALGLIPPGVKARIALLSDGRDTHGGVEDAMQAAVARGVPVDTMSLQPERTGAKRLAVNVREQVVHPQATVAGEVALYAGKNSLQNDLKLFFDDQLLQTQPIALAPGETLFVPVEVNPPAEAAAGTHQIRATLGTLSHSVPLVVTHPPRVLFVSNHPTEAAEFSKALATEQIRVESIRPAQLLTQLDASVHLVVLGSVPAHGAGGLGYQAARALAEYVQAGGGLISLGGPQSYGAGGWEQSPLAPVLPVDLSPSHQEVEPSVSLVVVLDNSGSMNERSTGQTKMSLANEGAVASVGLLRDRDAVGVMAVNSEVNWVVPFGPLGNRVAMRQAIRGIGAGGEGLYVYTSLDAAYKALAASKNTLKHVIVFCDAADAEEKVQGTPLGWGGGRSSYDLVDAMHKQGITVSVIGLGLPSDPDYRFLRKLAQLGGGRFRVTHDASQLRGLFAQETRQLIDPLARNKPITVRAADPHPALEGLVWHRAPPLLGLVTLHKRPTATVPLVGSHGAAVLVTWQYGLGRVASFAADAGTNWSAKWVNWSGYSRFWTQLVRWGLKRRETSAPAIELAGSSERVVLRVLRRTTKPSQQASQLTARITPLLPRAFDPIQVPLGEDFGRITRQEPRLWQAKLSLPPQVPVLIEVLDATEQVVVSQQAVTPRSAEDGPPNREVLTNLSKQTGGVSLAKGDTWPPLDPARGQQSTRLAFWLVLLAMGLLPLDAWLRRELRR